MILRLKHYIYVFSVAKPHEWARCFLKGAVPSNLFSERFNMELKKKSLPKDRIDLLVSYLEDLELLYGTKAIRVSLNLRGLHKSKAQSYHDAAHPSQERFEMYQVVDNGDRTFTVSSARQFDEQPYLVQRNQFTVCQQENCLLRCRQCGPSPPCCHFLTCECQAYAYKNYCPHVHMVVMKNFIPPSTAVRRAATIADQDSQHRRDVSNGLPHIDQLESINVQRCDNEIEQELPPPDSTLSCDVSNDEYTSSFIPQTDADFNQEAASEALPNDDSVYVTIPNEEAPSAAVPNDDSVSGTFPNEDAALEYLANGEPCTEDAVRIVQDDDHGTMTRNILTDCQMEKDRNNELLSAVRREHDRADYNEETLNEFRQFGQIMRSFLAITKKFPSRPERRRTHQPVSRTPVPHKNKRRKPWPLPDRNAHIQESVRIAFQANEEHQNWPWILAAKDNVLKNHMKMYGEEDQEKISARIEAAKTYWNCPSCNDFDIANVRSGYIACCECNIYYHQRCVNMEVILHSMNLKSRTC